MNEQQQNRLRELYRRSRQEQPSAALDQRILNSARRVRNRGRNRWVWGLSTAAVALLSFNVVLQIYFDASGPMEAEMLDLPSYKPRASAESTSPSSPPRPPSQMMEQRMPLPAAPVEEAVIESYELRPQPMMAPELLLQDRAADIKREKERALFKRSVAGAQRMQKSKSRHLPRLPSRLDELLARATGLSGEETASGKVIVYAGNKLILTVEDNEKGSRFKAWQGVQVLGITQDWNFTPSDLDACRKQTVFTSCNLPSGVVGFYSDGRLDHISWIQAHE